MEAAHARATGAAVPAVAALIAIYAISQFLRNSVGVIAPNLTAELQLDATSLGLLSSAFFLSFAAAQIPVGVAIDRYGPKATMLVCAGIAVAGTLLFALSPSAETLVLSRMLMGLGCSSFFMAPLAIYARRFPPERFASLTAIQLGTASFGTLFATAPLAFATAEIGWRAAFVTAAAITALVGLVVYLLVPADARDEGPRESWGETLRGVGAALRARSFWNVFTIHLTSYSAFATVIGLWAGPWLTDLYGADLATRGNVLLLGALAQIAGLFAWGAADRYFRSYRRAGLIGGALSVLLLAVPIFLPLSLVTAAIWLGVFGFVVAYTPIVTAHGKALFPANLTGRGITLMNAGTMGGVFIFQALTGLVVDFFPPIGTGYSEEAYRAIFATLAVGLAVALVIYARSDDPHPSAK